MRTTSDLLLSTAILVGVLLALWLAITFLPDGELWFITFASSMFAYKACKKLGWLALLLIPVFPFLLIALEMDRPYGERYPFGIAIATWSVFALAAIMGAWRWWKRLQNSAPNT